MKITPSWFEVAVASGVSNTETWGYFGANISVGAKTLGVWQGSFTRLVEQLPRSTWHVISLVYERCGAKWGQSQILGAMTPHAPP